MARITTRSGVSLHCRIEGPPDAPVVVLVNSIGADIRMWEPQVPVLVERFRVLRYDARGHGASDVPPGPYSIDQLGHDLLDLLAALELERVHVCGISLGGLTALWVAATHRERVDRAIYASTAARIGTPEAWDERARMVRAGGMSAVHDLVLRRFFTEAVLGSGSEPVRHVDEAVAAIPADAYVACCVALRDADLHDAVSHIEAPSLVIAGEQDVSTPVAQAHELGRLIPGSDVAVIGGASHLCNIENPAEFNRLLLGHLATPRAHGR